MTRSSLFPVLFLTLLTIPACARQIPTPDRTLNVNMSTSVDLPADLIVFNINMNAEGSTPKEAFELHQKREELLISQLKRFDIESKNIKFQPVQINKRYRNDSKNLYSQTSQQVRITFSNFDIYAQIQLMLIENGFDSFSANFTSTKLEEGKSDALKKAIHAAKDKAVFIAEASGVKLGTIQNINYSEFSNAPVYRMAMSAESADASLLDIPQAVSVTASIAITFNLIH